MFYEYDRLGAVDYAKTWALKRNPKFIDYSDMGGDCTNYISQCVNAGNINMDKIGSNIMQQWYWYSDKERTPSWTGAEFFYQYFINNNKESTSRFGVFAMATDYSNLDLGDVVQLVENNKAYHTMIVTDVIYYEDVLIDFLVSQHSYDLLDFPLSQKIGEKRFLKILGYYK